MSNNTHAIKVCIGNYASYAAGYLVDRWVTLPMSNDELDAAVKSVIADARAVVTGDDCEEIYISDYEVPVDVLVDGCHDIHQLDTLAKMCDVADDDQLAAARILAECVGYDALTYACCLQHVIDGDAEIYEIPDYGWGSDEGNYGEMILEESGIPSSMRWLEGYIDCEAIGRDSDDYISDGHYIRCGARVSQDYTWDELATEYAD